MISIESILLFAFLLGLAHGITPDEHTWPITFSYAIGSYSVKGGFKAGLFFSLAFTIQTAIMSELSFLALSSIFMNNVVESIVFIMVGVVMWIAGVYILNKKTYLHTHFIDKFIHKIIVKADKECDFSTPSCFNQRSVPIRMTLIHGFIAGFAIGAFTLIVYTVLAPAMPNMYTGFLPGALFGFGTMIMQILFGMAFGKWMESRKYTTAEIQFIATHTSGSMLYYGGMAFMGMGIIMVLSTVFHIIPNPETIGIHTPIPIYNLSFLGIGFFLVMLILVLIAIPAYIHSIRLVKNNRISTVL